MSLATLNGVRATKDGVKAIGGLSNAIVDKDMLLAVKGSYKAYSQYIASGKDEEKKKPKEAQFDKKKLEAFKKSADTLSEREKKAEEVLQSSSKFLEEGNKRMAEGLHKKNFDEIEAAQKLIELATEKQAKVQEEMRSIHAQKKKATEELTKKIVKKS